MFISSQLPGHTSMCIWLCVFPPLIVFTFIICNDFIQLGWYSVQYGLLFFSSDVIECIAMCVCVCMCMGYPPFKLFNKGYTF